MKTFEEREKLYLTDYEQQCEKYPKFLLEKELVVRVIKEIAKIPCEKAILQYCGDGVKFTLILENGQTFMITKPFDIDFILDDLTDIVIFSLFSKESESLCHHWNNLDKFVDGVISYISL